MSHVPIQRAGEDLLLVRLAPELTTKARGTRKRFMRRLVENVRDAVSGGATGVHVEAQWTRLFIRTADPGTVARLIRVPGISSVSRVEARCSADLDEIVRNGVERYADAVRGRSYAIRARRTGTHSFSSQDVQQALGAALNPGARVDLRDPEVEVEVEVRDRFAYLFSGRTQGLGGLPLAVEGRALCLLSGGFDSAAAAWLMLKRGVQLDYLLCNLAGEFNERSVVQVAKVLADGWSFGTRPRLFVVDFQPVVDELRASSSPRFWQLVLKRLMYRAADRLANETGASAIITGESLGQVSSQTLANLAATDSASSIPVFRPLLGFDKMEILDLARRIGTYELSARIKEYCAIAPGNPITDATAEQAEREEQKVDSRVLATAMQDRRVLDLREMNAADLVESYLFTDEVSEGAVVLDLRAEDDRRGAPLPDASVREDWELLATASDLEQGVRYVIVCEVGMRAAGIAEQLQRKGFEAYAFRGGARAFRRYLEAVATR
jgi:tRNA uracil 4-sulfurtransferase